MTIEELKEHCEKTIEHIERTDAAFGRNPNDSRSYQEHKLVLELIKKVQRYESIFTTTEFKELSLNNDIDWSNSTFESCIAEIIERMSKGDE